MNRIIATIILLSCVGITYSKLKPVNEYGQLYVEGTNIVDQSGRKVALKGISLGWHNWWPQFYNEQVVEILTRKWNISVIRAAMGVEPAGSYLNDPENSEAIIKEVIDAAISNGIYVIIDWHSHDIYAEQAEEFFSRMAQQYAGYPNIIYEIFNEPENRSWDEIKEYSIRIIEAIRRYDDTNLIIVGTPNWSQDVDTAADDPIYGYDNIVYSLHFYAASHKDNIRSKAEYAIGEDLPLFVSECSPVNAFGDGVLDKKEFSRWMKLLKRNGIGFVMWGLYDKDESSAMLKPGANPRGRWPVSQLTRMGIYSRKVIGGRMGSTETVSLVGILAIMAIVYVLIRKSK